MSPSFAILGWDGGSAPPRTADLTFDTGEPMNRRAFLRQAGVAALGLAAVPIVSAVRFWTGRPEARDDQVEADLESYNLTEADVIDLTLNYADSYADVLPGVNIRESLLNRLRKDQAGSTPA